MELIIRGIYQKNSLHLSRGKVGIKSQIKLPYVGIRDYTIRQSNNCLRMVLFIHKSLYCWLAFATIFSSINFAKNNAWSSKSSSLTEP